NRAAGKGKSAAEPGDLAERVVERTARSDNADQPEVSAGETSGRLPEVSAKATGMAAVRICAAGWIQRFARGRPPRGAIAGKFAGEGEFDSVESGRSAAQEAGAGACFGISADTHRQRCA